MAAYGPKARRAYVEIPPASGNRAPRAAKVIASGADSTTRANQATMDAGPAMPAAMAGSEMTPVPSTAPTVRAAP